MSTDAIDPITSLPAVSSTRLRRDWLNVTAQLAECGALGLTTHARVEAVLLDPREYLALLARAQAADEAWTAELRRRFDERLASLNEPGAGEALREAFDRGGRFTGPVVAGEGF